MSLITVAAATAVLRQAGRTVTRVTKVDAARRHGCQTLQYVIDGQAVTIGRLRQLAAELGASTSDLPELATEIQALPGVESLEHETDGWCCHLAHGWTTDALGGGGTIIDPSLRTIRAHVVGAYPKPPVATLVAVNGQPDGDYLAPFTGAPACGGETHLSPWQAADLIARGYRWAHQWEPGAPEPDAATLAAIAAAAPAAPTPTEPSLADTLAALTAAVIAEHDSAMAATEATLARVKALVNELAELD